MSRKRFTAEQIIGLLREANVKLSRGRNVGHICREIGISEQTYGRWRKEYGGMKTAQIRKLKETGQSGSPAVEADRGSDALYRTG